MAFTAAQKTDIRRYCGYPAYGAGPSGFSGWRFFQAYGLMEFRLNNMDPTEEAVVITTYLANLATLESAIPASSGNLDTESAAVWTHNPRELQDRDRLFDGWRRRLCQFLGLPPGPFLMSGSAANVVV